MMMDSSFERTVSSSVGGTLSIMQMMAFMPGRALTSLNIGISSSIFSDLVFLHAIRMLESLTRFAISPPPSSLPVS